MSHYIVIMAGGTGTRLWPLSRKKKPKQFQSFISSKTLIQETFYRALQVVSVDHVFVSTNKNCLELVLEQIPEISQKNIIIEPESRNTAPAIALVAATIAASDSDAIIATIASDHAIENEEEFVSTLRAALVTADTHREKLVTVGVNPNSPDTGLGYIKMGREFATIEGRRVFFIETFKEKPDRKTAEKYLASWEYLWNAGYFIFSASNFTKWTKEFSPQLSDTIEKIMDEKKKGVLDEKKFESLYSLAASEAVEPVIVEKLLPENRLVIPSALKWSDVGNWETLYEFLAKKEGADSVTTHDDHIDIGSKNIFIHGKKGKLIATLGLEDTVIIDTDDALLIARRDHVSTEMKSLVKKIEDEGKKDVL